MVAVEWSDKKILEKKTKTMEFVKQIEANHRNLIYNNFT